MQFTHSKIVRLYVFCEISSSYYELYCANCAQSMTDDPKEYWYKKLKSEETTEQSLLLRPCHNPLNMGPTLTNASLCMAHGPWPPPGAPSPFLSAAVSKKTSFLQLFHPLELAGPLARGTCKPRAASNNVLRLGTNSHGCRIGHHVR